ncbi:hypothetical protein J2Y55_004035 [Bosea sp. BE125]|jgi:hypothetical protein|uniref:hypothetical protein n=1 Tax=Bosea sp. BE125 TaxID=2817909 RepID=UPI002854CBAC|nr:hypothetical protein [Bosea sp. BE125]MDR6873011.1 hypothetical protein [Bosea sp. BE125]
MSIALIGVLTLLIGLACLMPGTGALVHRLAIMAVPGAAAAMLIGSLPIGPIIDQGFFCMLAAAAAAIRPQGSDVPKPVPLVTGARL